MFPIRQPVIDLITNGDASISWHTRYIPQQSYNNNNKNTHRTQGQRFKPSVALVTDDRDFKPFQPQPGAYKNYQNTNPFKITQAPTAYQYFNTETTSKPPSKHLPDNYSYFNLGGDRLTTPSYTTSATKLIHHYYHPTNSPSNLTNPTVNPQTNSSYHSSHVQYINNHRMKTNEQKQPHKHNKPYSTHVDTKEDEPKHEEDEEHQEDVEEDDDRRETGNYDANDVKPQYPQFPDYYSKPVNKYEHIRNPFADPNFDFDKFLAKLREGHNYHLGVVETESKMKPIAYQRDKGKFGPENVDLRKPVAFSSPGGKKLIQKPLEEEYYYDDEEEEKPRKHAKYEEKDKAGIGSHRVKDLKGITELFNTKPITFSSEVPEKLKESTKGKEEVEDDEEYEYYDDYDYVHPPKSIKQTQISHNPVYTNPKPLTNVTPKIVPAYYETVVYQNRTTPKPVFTVRPRQRPPKQTDPPKPTTTPRPFSRSRQTTPRPLTYPDRNNDFRRHNSTDDSKR